MSKGILQVHPPICDCPGCRISSPVNRGRLAEKRTIPLPPSRLPKKELGSAFCHSEDSQESEQSHGQQPQVKQEEDLHISIMKRRIHTHWDLNISFRETSCSRDSDLSSIISSLQQSQQLVMPETQSRCEFKRSSLDVGLAAADEILGKRRVCSPNSSSECPLESKKARSESPKENSQTAVLEEAVAQMTPEEHYRRMMSALNEHGSFEEQQQQQQRLYQLANSMAVPSHGDLLRARQEVAAAAARTPGAMEAHIPSASNSSSQRRKQGLPQHRDSHFPDREISHPPPLLSPQNAPHIALGPHLRPPFLGVPSALCQTPGYGFLQPAQAEMFARQQEMLRKQNLARLEMSAELIRQKELENLHRQRLLAGDPLSLHPGLPPDHPALRSVHDVPEGHALRDELSRRNAMLVLRHNNAPLLSLTPGGPGTATPPKEQPRRAGGGRKSSQPRAEPQGPGEAREAAEARGRDGAQDCNNEEEMKDSESDGEDKAEGLKAEGGSGGELKECKDGAGKACEAAKEPSEAAPGVPCGSSSAESPSHLLGAGVGKAEVKYLPPASLAAPQPLPFGFPYTMSPYFHAGEAGRCFGMCLAVLERRDLPPASSHSGGSGVSLSPALAVSPQVFREQAIDGETLPLLTEEHLLNNMGLKLGPALKIRSQVARRLGRVLYMAGFPVALPLQPPGLRPPEREAAAGELRPASTGSVASPFGSAVPSSRGSPKQE
ncbi:SAM11 protein, partial [Picathartes gymnocephalus]|nr:SAM11 protein [Picathartes gymnocephalus]